MPTQKKIDTVSNLTEKINRAKAMVFVDYRGLKHKQMEELRKNLKKTEGELMVAKNRLMIRALRFAQGKLSEKGLSSVLSDTTATLFSYADEVAPLKELLKYLKVAGFGKAKAGLLGTSFLSQSEVTRLAALPNRQTLLGQLAGQLNAPIQGLHRSLSWNLQKFVYALMAVEKLKSQNANLKTTT